MNVSVKTLSKRLPDVLRALKKREKVVLSHEGEDVALLQPLPEPVDELDRFVNSSLFGMLSDREDMDDPSAWVRAMRIRVDGTACPQGRIGRGGRSYRRDRD